MRPKVIKSAIKSIISLIAIIIFTPVHTSYAGNYSYSIQNQLRNLSKSSMLEKGSTPSAEKRMIGYSKEDKVTLTLEDNSGVYQSVIRFKTGATEDFDGRYDAYFWMGEPNNSILYSTHKNLQYSINSMPDSYSEGIQLVLQTNTPEEFTLNYKVNLGFEDYAILLIDKLNDEIHILAGEGELTLSNPTKLSNDRFEILHYKLISTGTNIANNSIPRIGYNNSTHTLNASSNIEQITIHSISGKTLFSSRLNQSSFSVPFALQNQAAIIVAEINGKTQVIKTVL